MEPAFSVGPRDHRALGTRDNDGESNSVWQSLPICRYDALSSGGRQTDTDLTVHLVLHSTGSKTDRTYPKSLRGVYEKIGNLGAVAAFPNPTYAPMFAALAVSLAPRLITGFCRCLNIWLKARAGRTIAITVGHLTLKTRGISEGAFRELLQDAQKVLARRTNQGIDREKGPRRPTRGR